MIYRVEASRDLADWTQAVLQLAGATLSSDDCFETVTYETGNAGETAFYLQLAVQFQ